MLMRSYVNITHNTGSLVVTVGHNILIWCLNGTTGLSEIMDACPIQARAVQVKQYIPVWCASCKIAHLPVLE